MFDAFLLLAAATAEEPIVTFKDWAVGCDNGRSCMAVGQMSETNYDLASIVVERGPLPSDVPRIWFRNEDSKIIDLAADGKRLGVGLVPDADDWALTVAPASSLKVIAALKSASSLVPVRADGVKAVPLSISGASAAMRWIDEQQKRVGTVTALVATGSNPPSSVPPPPPLPVVTRAIPSGALGKPLTNAEVATIQEEHAGCTDDDLSDKVEYARIDSRTTLAIVTAMCGSGAYNYFGIPMLLRDDGTREVADVGKHEEGDVTMNLSWDSSESLLTSHFKGRGLGDCGASTNWAWDGRRFQVVQEKAMGECLGAIAWIPYYRARVVTK